MRFSKYIVLAGLLLVLAQHQPVLGDTYSSELFQLLPERVGEFMRVGTPTPPDALQGVLTPREGSPQMAGQAEYVGRGQRLRLEVVRFRQDAEAYGLLTIVSALEREKRRELELETGNGIASFTVDNQTAFSKGVHFVRVTQLKPSKEFAPVTAFAAAFANNLDKGEGEIPVLVKHLPRPDEAQKSAVYLARFSDLQPIAPNQPVLSVVQAGGDADAVLATVDSSKVLLVEFNTPQLAGDNDRRIIAKIQELWKLGQPAPTAYRRVGNYSVFVFDGRDEQTARQLIDQIKYEQSVTWLGENPNILKEAQRRYVNTTLGVFIAVLKASGFALIGCLAVGGLIGALLFTRRRAQQRNVEAFSDAGGIVRLNLDELTPKPTTDPARLLRDQN